MSDPTEVWDSPCDNCPSMQPLDYEAADIAQWCREGKMDPFQAVFLCAWRPTKICYGVALNVGYPKEADPGIEKESRNEPD